MKLQWLKNMKPVTHADKALDYVEKSLALVRQRINSEYVVLRIRLEEL